MCQLAQTDEAKGTEILIDQIFRSIAPYEILGSFSSVGTGSRFCDSLIQPKRKNIFACVHEVGGGDTCVPLSLHATHTPDPTLASPPVLHLGTIQKYQECFI